MYSSTLIQKTVMIKFRTDHTKMVTGPTSLDSNPTHLTATPMACKKSKNFLQFWLVEGCHLSVVCWTRSTRKVQCHPWHEIDNGRTQTTECGCLNTCWWRFQTVLYEACFPLTKHPDTAPPLLLLAVISCYLGKKKKLSLSLSLFYIKYWLTYGKDIVQNI